MTTLFENSDILIRLNQCNEIFITNKRKPKTEQDYRQAELRIDVYGKDSFTLTADGCNYRPNTFGGLPGFVIGLAK